MNSLPSLPRRFWSKVQPVDDGCWLWRSASNGRYGVFWLGGRNVSAHRLAYEWLWGKIPSELQIDHLCRNRLCVNPLHLEAVTSPVNVRRGIRPAQMRAITHCPQGHPYSGDNLYIRPGNGYRQCRECTNRPLHYVPVVMEHDPRTGRFTGRKQ